MEQLKMVNGNNLTARVFIKIQFLKTIATIFFKPLTHWDNLT